MTKKNNSNELQIKKWIHESMRDGVYSWENTILDFMPEDEEYQEAMKILSDIEGIKEMVLSNVKAEMECSRSKHLKFIGNERLEEMVNKKVDKWFVEDGYEYSK